MLFEFCNYTNFEEQFILIFFYLLLNFFCIDTKGSMRNST